MNNIFGIILVFNAVIFHLFDVAYLLTLLTGLLCRPILFCDPLESTLGQLVFINVIHE